MPVAQIVQIVLNVYLGNLLVGPEHHIGLARHVILHV